MTLNDMPSIVFFDWDNTLSDTFPGLFDSYNHMLRHFDMPEWDEATAKRNIRRVAHEYLPGLLGEDRWEEGLQVYRDYYYSKYKDAPMYDGALRVMEILKGRGTRLGIISNKNETILKAAAEISVFAPYLDVTLGAVNDRAGKPDPAPMELALQALGYEGARENIWYVGDTDIDMEFAANTGARGIFVENAGLDTLDDVKGRFAPLGAFRNMIEFADALS